MMRLATIVLLLFTFFEANAQSPQVASGLVERIEWKNSAFIRGSRTIDVWLPPGYDTTKTYPVLYMHDGQMLFDSTGTWNQQEWKMDEIVGKAISEGQWKPFVVVGIWNVGKFRPYEFYPQKALAYLSDEQRDSLDNTMETQASSDAYLSFIVNELKPYIELKYHVSSRKEDVTIGGASRGGIISLYALCEYPEVFGNAMCMSTHWIGGFIQKDPVLANATMQYFKAHIPKRNGHRIYFDHGTLGLDAEYHERQVELNKAFRRKRWLREGIWLFAVYPGDDHNERAWSGRLQVPLSFFYNVK